MCRHLNGREFYRFSGRPVSRDKTIIQVFPIADAFQVDVSIALHCCVSQAFTYVSAENNNASVREQCAHDAINYRVNNERLPLPKNSGKR